MKHLILLAALSLIIAGVYARVTAAYFCAYDDFIEIHRAAFEDTREPSRIFTTPHFNSYKYRPLNRAMTLVTYWGGYGDPIVFRLRNLSFHLVNVALVYTLGWLLFRSTWVSSGGAAFVGLHPLANQTTIGAVWPSTMAHAGFLLAIVLFVVSVQRQPRLPWLIGSLVSAWLSLLSYDTAITVFALMPVYLVAYWFARRGESVGRQFVVVFGTLSGVLITTYFVLRNLFAPRAWEQITGDLPSAGIVVRNLSMYLLALLSPIDSVLANEVIHTPLPSEITLTRSVFIFAGFAALVAGLGVFSTLWWTKRNWQNGDWAAVVFLVAGILVPLLPVLFFANHPSETYLYLPVAFYGLLLSYGLAIVLFEPLSPKGYALYVSSVVLLIILFGAATWVRNDRVVECARTARRILYGLPSELSAGAWTVALANVPGEPISHRYGFYGFRGVDTIGHREMANRALTSALQIFYKNESVNGVVVEPGELVDRCRSGARSRNLCLWVHWDGRLERAN